MRISSPDLKCNDLVLIIYKLHKLDLSEENLKNLSYQDRCRLLNSNPVLVAEYFYYQVEVFFKEIIVDGPLGKTKYYAIRLEFQVCDSPHAHYFLWVFNAPVLTLNIDQILYIHSYPGKEKQTRTS